MCGYMLLLVYPGILCLYHAYSLTHKNPISHLAIARSTFSVHSVKSFLEHTAVSMEQLYFCLRYFFVHVYFSLGILFVSVFFICLFCILFLFFFCVVFLSCVSPCLHMLAALLYPPISLCNLLLGYLR